MNKMSLEMQQQQMRPMMLYMIPSFMLWIFVFPSIFGQTVALSPLTIPYITCSDANVKTYNPPQITNHAHTNKIIKGKNFWEEIIFRKGNRLFPTWRLSYN